ncbi:MAG: ABC transporter ATP-binding protein [Firmicutes bacterium]|nr:ABC transporter ATP-binding protein [Bacillota bacterium]
MTLEGGVQRKSQPLLTIKDLRTEFRTETGLVRAVDGIDLTIHREETVGLVGESGCGKSVTSLSIMGLVPQPPGRITGSIVYHHPDGDIDLARLNPKGDQYRSIRGKEISMIFQEPMTSLNPVYTVGEQIIEAIRLHQGLTEQESREKAIELLDKVGIPSPQQRVDEYPHQMSGGMRQRVMIAMALSCNPSLLIADEPTTALDVTIQAQILMLMQELQDEFNASILLITHDLGVVAGMADKIAVMYLGQIVEYGTARDVFKQHLHPYTEGLLNSIPIPRPKRTRMLKPIEGTVPDPRWMPPGCRFSNRCGYAMEICSQAPGLYEPSPGHQVRCWLYQDAREVS